MGSGGSGGGLGGFSDRRIRRFVTLQSAFLGKSLNPKFLPMLRY